MALVKMARLMEDALEKKYTVGAYNIFNIETLSAVLEAAEEEDSPLILQVSMGARRHQYNLECFIESVKLYAEAVKIPVAINHDHCMNLEAAKSAVDMGLSSVMFDGSHLEYEENIKQTKRIVEYAHKKDVWVEAELGSIPGMEDDAFSENTVFTDPSQVTGFVERSGCDSLAVSVGTSHGGVKADDYLTFRFDILKEIHAKLGRYPLVLHGAASFPEALVNEINSYGASVSQMRNCSEKDVSEAGKYGVCKANMDVDNFLLYTAAIRKYHLEHPEKYDPRGYLRLARESFKNEVAHKMRNVSRSSGKNWLKGESE